MWFLVFSVCCLVFDLTQANDQCWCTDSDMTILKAPAHSAIAVDVLTSGSCLNTSQFEFHGPWIQIKTTEKSGFVHHAYSINLKDCADSGVLKRADSCPSHCMEFCCSRAASHEHYHHSHHSSFGCDACGSSCCSPVLTSQHGGHTDKSEWSLYSDCSVTCGEGTQTRYCTAHCSDDSPTEIKVCREQDCPPEWSPYGDCSVTCGVGTQTRYCTAHCSHDSQTDIKECRKQDCPPEWSPYGDCSVTCGEGTQTRYCTAHCSPDSPTEIKVCREQDCPPEWSPYGHCSVTCGVGTQTRYCTAHCSHDSQTDIKICNEQDCPPEWSQYGDCSVTCGVGTQTRYCTGHCSHDSPTDIKVCREQDCPPGVHRCDKFGTIQALAEQNVTSTVHCPDRWNSRTENFVFTHCQNVPSVTNAWHRGESVLNDCQGSKAIQPFTPIGTFSQLGYEQGGHTGISGIFLSCTAHGFKMATKACDGGAEVIAIPHDTSAILSSDAFVSNNPASYFTIKW